MDESSTSKMLPEVPKFITRAYIKSMYGKMYFVFGDNLLKSGYGGQARECRGEPNCFGVPTKFRPSVSSGSYFTDKTFVTNSAAIDAAINKIPRDLPIYVIPNIGRGLSRMDSFAPRSYEYMISELRKIAFNDNF